MEVKKYAMIALICFVVVYVMFNVSYTRNLLGVAPTA